MDGGKETHHHQLLLTMQLMHKDSECKAVSPSGPEEVSRRGQTLAPHCLSTKHPPLPAIKDNERHPSLQWNPLNLAGVAGSILKLPASPEADQLVNG